MQYKDHVVVHQDADHQCRRFLEGPMTEGEAQKRVTELRINADMIASVVNLQTVILPKAGSDIVLSSKGYYSPLQKILQELSIQERVVLTYIFLLLEDYNYRRVTDLDLYTGVPDLDYEQVPAILTALHEKHLIEMPIGTHALVSHVLITDDLSESELEVLTAIVGFQHAFSKAIDFRNVCGNVRNVPEDIIPSLLIKLAQRGLITLSEDYTVHETFTGLETIPA